MPRITIVTFHSEGAPHDDGLSLTPQATALRQIADAKGVGFEAYTPRRLRELGADEVIRSFPDTYRLSCNPGLHKVGLGAWKPFIILHTLANLNDGDVVFYQDVNITKYPGLAAKAAAVHTIVDTALENTDFFVGRDHVLSTRERACQYSSLAQLSVIGRNTLFAKNFPVLIVNNIIARKSAFASDLLLDWLALCMVDALILPPLTPQEHLPEYKWPCPEQMVLNAVVARHIEEGLLPWYYPNLSYGRGDIPDIPENMHVAWLAGSPRLSAETPTLRQQFAAEIAHARAYVAAHIAPQFVSEKAA